MPFMWFAFQNKRAEHLDIPQEQRQFVDCFRKCPSLNKNRLAFVKSAFNALKVILNPWNKDQQPSGHTCTRAIRSK